MFRRAAGILFTAGATSDILPLITRSGERTNPTMLVIAAVVTLAAAGLLQVWRRPPDLVLLVLPAYGTLLVMMSIVGMLEYNFQVILPVFAKETFSGDATTFGLLGATLGIGIASSNIPKFGPNVVTQDFGSREGAKANLLGVAFDDKNQNTFYDAGEGVGGVVIDIKNLANDSADSVETWDQGGYQVELEPGSYRVSVGGDARYSSAVSRPVGLH